MCSSWGVHGFISNDRDKMSHIETLRSDHTIGRSHHMSLCTIWKDSITKWVSSMSTGASVSFEDSGQRSSAPSRDELTQWERQLAQRERELHEKERQLWQWEHDLMRRDLHSKQQQQLHNHYRPYHPQQFTGSQQSNYWRGNTAHQQYRFRNSRGGRGHSDQDVYTNPPREDLAEPPRQEVPLTRQEVPQKILQRSPKHSQD